MFRDYFAREYFRATQKAPTASALKDAISMLAATARIKSEYPVFTRIAQVGETLWLDLGRSEWDAVRGPPIDSSRIARLIKDVIES